MALTDAQIADVRRFAGYPALGTDTVATDDRDVAYAWFLPGQWWQTMYHRLKNLTPENEATLINTYLLKLNTLEQNIITAGDNLDTESAAVWKRNANEIGDRMALFDSWRRRMCGFLGIAPGPALGDGSVRVVRA